MSRFGAAAEANIAAGGEADRFAVAASARRGKGRKAVVDNEFFSAPAIARGYWVDEPTIFETGAAMLFGQRIYGDSVLSLHRGGEFMNNRLNANFEDSSPGGKR